MSAAITALLLSPAAAVQAGELFKISNSQALSCGRGHARGGLSTATCTSYTYVFNTKTSAYFRCQFSLVLTRNQKEVLLVLSDGGCTKKERIFETESNYEFDATETEPPNTNYIFGRGGHSIWAIDTTQQKVRGCITISSGLGSNISKCLDMTFQ